MIKEKLTPMLKWAGGKEKELQYILPRIPKHFNRYVEPFVGGGAVYFNIGSKDKCINDKSKELTNLYKLVQAGDETFFKKLDAIYHNWLRLEKIAVEHSAYLNQLYRDFSNETLSDAAFEDKIFEFIFQNSESFNGILKTTFNIDIEHFVMELKKNLIRKTKRMRVLEGQRGRLSDSDVDGNIETAFKSAYYMHMRYLYNNQKRFDISKEFHTAIYFFIREYCYASMFRYNQQGEFNVPYGGMSYNRKDFQKKISYLKNPKLQSYLGETQIFNEDFQTFFEAIALNEDDFIFLDPPYDSEFSDYEGNVFNGQDQRRLAEYVINGPAKFMIVIKNTPLIQELYFDKGLKIYAFDKKYLVSFQNRNDKDVEHLLITNYEA